MIGATMNKFAAHTCNKIIKFMVFELAAIIWLEDMKRPIGKDKFCEDVDDH